MSKKIKEGIALILIVFIFLVIILSLMGKWMNAHIWPWYALAGLIILVMIGLILYGVLWFREGKDR